MSETKTEAVGRLCWEVQTLRLTAFVDTPGPPLEQTWWKMVADDEPENVTGRPKAGERQEEGPFQGGRLALAIQPGRIDWLLGAAQPEGLPEGIPTLGALDATTKGFVEAMGPWLDRCPPINRLALGAVLIIPVTTRQESYRTLSKFLPFKLDVEGSSDFMYRINRPRPSKTGTPGLQINRLGTWAAMVLANVAVLPPVVRPLMIEFHGCRLEVDCNTAPDFQGQLTTEQVRPVFQELVGTTLELAEKGDVLPC